MQVLPLAAFDQEGSDTLYGTCEGQAGILTLLLEGATDAQQPQDVRKLCGTCEFVRTERLPHDSRWWSAL